MNADWQALKAFALSRGLPQVTVDRLCRGWVDSVTRALDADR